MCNFKPIILFTIIFFAGFSAFAQEHQHTEHLSTLLNHYLDAKNALAEDDFKAAHLAVSDIKDEVIENDEMNNHEEHAQMHAKHHASMVKAVNDAAQAEDIDGLRSSFKDVSSNLIKALKNQGYDEESLYLQYCPMAADGEGAQWISDQEKIINPYMGQKMPGCGQTEEMIESDH